MSNLTRVLVLASLAITSVGCANFRALTGSFYEEPPNGVPIEFVNETERDAQLTLDNYFVVVDATADGTFEGSLLRPGKSAHIKVAPGVRSLTVDHRTMSWKVEWEVEIHSPGTIRVCPTEDGSNQRLRITGEGNRVIEGSKVYK